MIHDTITSNTYMLCGCVFSGEKSIDLGSENQERHQSQFFDCYQRVGFLLDDFLDFWCKNRVQTELSERVSLFNCGQGFVTWKSKINQSHMKIMTTFHQVCLGTRSSSDMHSNSVRNYYNFSGQRE